MTISHWGEFEAPKRYLPSESFPRGADYIHQRKREQFDGKEWKLLSIVENGVEIFHA